jgi:hypothetical protein
MFNRRGRSRLLDFRRDGPRPDRVTYGKIDVISSGFGLGDPTANPTQVTLNTDWNLGQSGNHSYTKWIKTLNAPTVFTANNQLDITATNISKVVIDPIRARVDCNAIVKRRERRPDYRSDSMAVSRGDVDLSDALGCDDINAAKALVGAHQGDANYNFRADVDDNGVIDLLDVKYIRAALARIPPNGIYSCP